MFNPFKYRYKALIHIKCTQDDIWRALTDLDSYHLWNPFTTKVDTNWKVGDPGFLTVNMNKGNKLIVQTEYLTRFIPKDELAWGMRWSIFLKAERVQQIRVDTDSNVSYFTEDIIEGILSPLVHLIYGKSIQEGFDKLAHSLKKYLEKS